MRRNLCAVSEEKVKSRADLWGGCMLIRICFWLITTLAVVAPLMAQDRGARGGAGAPAAAGPAMTMTVAGFPDGGQFPVKYSQAAPGVATGEGTSPAINWTNPPAGTQSFVLHMHDMDVVRNK